MNKTRRHVSHQESTRGRGLRLTAETIRTLTAADLTQAVGGSCNTGSITTESLSPPNTKGCQ